MRKKVLALLTAVLMIQSLLPTVALAERTPAGIGIPAGEGKRIYNPTGEYDNLDNGAWYFFLSDTTIEKNQSVYGDKKSANVNGEEVSPYYNGRTMSDVVFSEHLGLWTLAELDYALWIPDSYKENPDGKYAFVMNNPVSQRDNVHPAALTRAGILTGSESNGGGGTNISSNDPTKKTASDYFISNEAQEQVKEMWGLDGIFVLVPTITNAGRVQDDATVPTQYSLLLLLCDALIKNYPIDTDHIYGTGESVGGMQLNQINTHRDNFLAGYVVNGSVWYSNFYKDTVFNGSMMTGQGNNANPARLERHYTLTDDRIIWNNLDPGDAGGEYDWLAWQNLYYMTSDDNILTVAEWTEWNMVLKGLTGYEFAKVTVDHSDGSDLLEKMASVNNTYNGRQMGLWQVNGIEKSGIGNFAIGRWLLNQTRKTEVDRLKFDINKPFEGTMGTEATGQPCMYQFQGLDYYFVPTPPTVTSSGLITTNAGSLFYNSHLIDTTNPVNSIRPAGWLPTVEETTVNTGSIGAYEPTATPLLTFPVTAAKIQSVTKLSADGGNLVVALEYNVNMKNAVINEVGDKVQSEYWAVDTNANKNGFSQANYPRADFVVLDTFDFYDQNGNLINDLYDIQTGTKIVEKDTEPVAASEYVLSMESRISKIYINDAPEAVKDAGDRTGSGNYLIVEIATSANPDAISVVQRAPIIAPEANALASANYKKVTTTLP